MEMKQHETWRFDDLGSGAPLFPERELKSGVCVAVHVMESDENRRKAGEKMKAAADAVKTDGSIAKILKDALANPGKVTADIALGAAMEVANVIGSVLTKDGDDAVGLFSSYFEMRASWDGHLKADRGGCSIELHEVKG